VESLKEIESLFCTLDHFIQSLKNVLRILNLLVLSGQSLKRVPDEKFGFRLKGGAELFEQTFHAIFFIGLDIDNGGLRQDEFFQILQNLLFFGGLFHNVTRIIHKSILNVNFICSVVEKGLNIWPFSHRIETSGEEDDRQY
jgi:hypothetical protein